MVYWNKGAKVMAHVFSTRLILTTMLALAAGTTALAQGMPGANIATATAQAAPVTHGGHGVLAVTIRVASGYHINAHKPADPDLIPTTWQGHAPAGMTFGAARFPAAKTVHASYEKLPMKVYMGRSVILVPFTVAKTVKPGHITLTGTLNYQGCNATSCFPPTSLPVHALVTVK
jgi:hypothetical protein